jgi:hypothetical protein
MFRKHAVLLNTVPGLELMVCDEGHRLKNIGGTKTMEALRCVVVSTENIHYALDDPLPCFLLWYMRVSSACKAQRRIILSGTPIQNDLDELYAVVSFVAPGFFGTYEFLTMHMWALIGSFSLCIVHGGPRFAVELQVAHLRADLPRQRIRRQRRGQGGGQRCGNRAASSPG